MRAWPARLGNVTTPSCDTGVRGSGGATTEAARRPGKTDASVTATWAVLRFAAAADRVLAGRRPTEALAVPGMTPPEPPEHAVNIKGTSNAISAAGRNRFIKKGLSERSEEARSPQANSDHCGFPRWKRARIGVPPDAGRRSRRWCALLLPRARPQTRICGDSKATERAKSPSQRTARAHPTRDSFGASAMRPTIPSVDAGSASWVAPTATRSRSRVSTERLETRGRELSRASSPRAG